MDLIYIYGHLIEGDFVHVYSGNTAMMMTATNLMYN